MFPIMMNGEAIELGMRFCALAILFCFACVFGWLSETLANLIVATGVWLGLWSRDESNVAHDSQEIQRVLKAIETLELVRADLSPSGRVELESARQHFERSRVSSRAEIELIWAERCCRKAAECTPHLTTEIARTLTKELDREKCFA